MANPKILNLDVLAEGQRRELVLNGKTHAIEEMTVENFIATTLAAELIKGNPDLSVHIEATIAGIKRCVPTVDAADLRKLSLEKMSLVASFVRGDEVTEATQAPETTPEAGVEGADTAGKTTTG